MIETPNLLLRPHQLADFEPWFAMYSDDTLFRFIGAPHLSREDAWNRLLRYAGHWSLLGYGLFAVLDRASGAFLGEVGLADFHRGLGEQFDPFPEAAWIMARAAQLSEPHFRKLFRETHGESPRAMRNRALMQKAAELVLHSGASMSEIAFQLGFSTVHNFSRAFSREIGAAPRDYQRKMLGPQDGATRASITQIFSL